MQIPCMGFGCCHMKWLQLGNARNMLMTVNTKVSIIVIAEIISSTDDTCLLHNYLLTTDLGLSSCYMSPN